MNWHLFFCRKGRGPDLKFDLAEVSPKARGLIYKVRHFYSQERWAPSKWAPNNGLKNGEKELGICYKAPSGHGVYLAIPTKAQLASAAEVFSFRYIFEKMSYKSTATALAVWSYERLDVSFAWSNISYGNPMKVCKPSIIQNISYNCQLIYWEWSM